MTYPWWRGLPAVDVELACGRAQHRVTWRDGELHTPDHPDADRERALVAFGADPYPCLELADAWAAHADDLDVLALAGRGPGDVLGNTGEAGPGRVSTQGGMAFLSPRQHAAMSASPNSGWTFYSPIPGLHQDEAGGLDGLLMLDGPLPDRLVATVVAQWAARIDEGDPVAAAREATLRAALYGRITPVTAGWLGSAVRVELTMVGPDAAVVAERTGDVLQLAVPFSWLRDVWARGMATVVGQLCLAVREVADGRWELQTVGPELGAVRTLTIA